NSLGAVMGVVALPVMLWGVLASERKQLRLRRAFAFTLALFLLLSSYARAGICAGTIACLLLCAVSRQYKLLVKGLVVTVFCAWWVVAGVPLRPNQDADLASVFVYKGKREEGVLGSRRSPWQRAVSVIEAHPWFGSGFGTSLTYTEHSAH